MKERAERKRLAEVGRVGHRAGAWVDPTCYPYLPKK